MPGIQTITSSGKVANQLMAIDKQIQGGQVSLAKYGMLMLKNEIDKMKLGELNKALQQKTTQLNKAIAEREKADKQINTLKFDNFKALETEKRENYEAMTDQRLDNIEATSKLRAAHNEALSKEKLSNIQSESDLRAAHNEAMSTERLENIESEANLELKGIRSEADLKAAHRKEIDKYARDLDAAKNAPEMLKRQAAKNYLDEFNKRVEEEDETLETWHYEMAQSAYATLIGVDAEKFDAQVADEEKRDRLAERVQELTNQQNRTPVAEAELRIMRAAQDGYLSDIDSKQLSEMFGWDVTEHEIENLKSKALGYLNKSKNILTPEPTAEGAPQAEPKLTESELALSEAYSTEAARVNSIIESMEIGRGDPKLREMQHEKDMKQTLDATEIEKARIEAGKPSTSKKSGTTLPTVHDLTEERKNFQKAWDEGRFERPDLAISADPHIKRMKLPKGYKIQNDILWVIDRDIGVKFKPGDPEAVKKSLPFAASFLGKFAADLRTEGYSPRQVLGLLNAMDAHSNNLGATGKSIPKQMVGNPAVQTVWTYGNIAATHGNLLDAFRNRLKTLAAQEGVNLQSMTNPNATAEEKTEALWKGFLGWQESVVKGLSPQQMTTSTTDATGTSDPGSVTPGQTMRVFDQKSKTFKDVRVERLIKDTRGNISDIVSEGKRMKVPKGAIMQGENVPVPKMSLGKELPKGTPVIYNGQQYFYHRRYAPMGYEVTDEEGNVIRLPVGKKTQLYFPAGLSTHRINQLLSGIGDTSSGAKHKIFRRPKPLNPTSAIAPSSEKSSGAQKKNKPTVSSTAASLTWETLKDGRQIARLDSEGRAMASVLNLRVPGKVGRNGWGSGVSGMIDGDTITGIEVQLPDLNQDQIPDDMLQLHGGKRVPLPEVWKKQEYNPGKGSVTTKDATVRLSGYFAEEMMLEDKKTLNPAGVRAQKALIRAFQQGWTDAKEKNRFIFKVRVVGTPDMAGPIAQRNKRYSNPYADRYNRIVTDVFVVVGGTEKKVAELTWAQPTEQLSREGHGERKTPWFLR